MDCKIEKCVRCSKKNQCQKYPIMQVLSASHGIDNKITVLSNIALNIIDKLDILQNSIDEIMQCEPDAEKQSFFDRMLKK